MRDRYSTIRHLTVDGRRVRCRWIAPCEGSEATAAIRQPLLLIHGIACSADAWAPSLPCLERLRLGQPVLAPDMPGYGHSPGPPEALGIDELADWTVRLMDTLGIRRAHVAGNSMGCQITLALARRHPERVGGLVLVGPPTGDRLVPRWRYFLGLLHDSAREPMFYNATLLRMYLQMGTRRYLATLPRMMEDDPFAQAGAVFAPCLIVRGERDPLVPEAVARRLVAALPHGAYTEVSGVAHAVQYSAPERFIRLALEFFQKTETARNARAATPPGATCRAV